MAHKPTYIDLFAGCGGLSLGLHNAGWKGLFAIEKSKDAFATLQHNLIITKKHFEWPQWLPQQHHDINQVLIDYKDQLMSLRGKIDLVAGGPPCQGFSTAGLRKEDDVRNGLVKSYLRFIEYTQPSLIFFENVKGFTLEFKKNKAQLHEVAESKGRAYSEYVLETLDKLGYHVKGEMVDFSKFGIPQRRTRFILVGFKKNLANTQSRRIDSFFTELSLFKKEFLKARKLPQNPKLSDAISDLLKVNGLEKTPDRTKKFFSGRYGAVQTSYQAFLKRGSVGGVPDSHSFPNHNPVTVEKFKLFLKAPRGKNLSVHFKKDLSINKHVIIPLSARQPAPTITTLPDDYIHYVEPRILTVREYARIQSFPDWYHFQGKYTTGGLQRKKEVPRYTQIGNAIPPLFAQQAGIALNKMIDE